MNVKQYLNNKIIKVSSSLWPDLKERGFDFEINYPPERRFGDYSCNIAMKLAPLIHRGPLEIADEIKKNFGNSAPLIKIEVVSPGFINFFIDNKFLGKQVEEIIEQKNKFGQNKLGDGQRIQLEFVSANPTGPITLGNGRGGFSGDVLANILKLSGYKVQREYYINDVGNQITILAESVLRRYWQHKGIRIEYPDYCYQGEYITELAKKIYIPDYKMNKNQKMEDIRDKIKGRILKKMIVDIKKVTEEKLGIKFDKFFEEHTLYSTGVVDRMLKELKRKNLLYKSDGAIWLRTRKYGDEKDRVLIKADGNPVYFLSDIAYHWNKFSRRKFDRVIDFFGADHHGYIGRLQATMKIFDFNGKLDIVITQMVRLLKKGEEVKMSKRAGTFITLEEIVDEVGLDATRYFFLMHDYNTHMDFDMNLAKKKTKDNPVYYVQYAHARICSIIRRAETLEFIPIKRGTTISNEEAKLVKKLLKWPEIIIEVADTYQVHKLTIYATEIAASFHEFYTNCQVIKGKKVDERRLKIMKVAQITLNNVLSSMGISSPERM
ncbi:MAG: arginine--tRNA ligase [Candidatus Kerfeldbacteria bacterium]